MSELALLSSVVSLGKTAVADTTAETTTAVEDMSGYDAIEYIVALGDVDAAAVLTFTAKENTASSTSSPTPTSITLATTTGSVGAITSGALVFTEDTGNLDNKIVRIYVEKNAMSKQYQFLSITATVESYEIVSIITIRHKARALPVTEDGDVVDHAYAAS